ncbi:hypothetical protein MYSE111917_00720 [Mycobacterium senriense]
MRGGAATRSSWYPSRPRADSRCLPTTPRAHRHYDYRRRYPRSRHTQQSFPETSEFRSHITRSASNSTSAQLRCRAAKDRVAPVLHISLPGARVRRSHDRPAPSAWAVCRSRHAERARMITQSLLLIAGFAQCGRRSPAALPGVIPQMRHKIASSNALADIRYKPTVDRADVEFHTRTMRKRIGACSVKPRVAAAVRARLFPPVATSQPVPGTHASRPGDVAAGWR